MVHTGRRSVLAATAATTSAVAGGCIGRLDDLVGDNPAPQVTLTIKATAPDDDPFADSVAHEVASWFRTAGMSVDVVSLAPSALRTHVLEDHEFDLFVSRVPGRYRDPDALHSLLHSRYAVGPGWNNPFGLTEEEVDDRLDAQRRRGGRARETTVVDLVEAVAEVEPFSVVCFPDEIRTARRDRFVGFSRASLEEPIGFLSVERAESEPEESDDGDGARGDDLHLATTDELVTETLNPLSTVGDTPAAVTEFLYDPLGRRFDDEVVPWLAEEWTFDDGSSEPRATVRLRGDLRWHDDEPVTADDVAFTYAFLGDARLSGGDDPLPVPRFRDRTSLVADASASDERSATIRFTDCDRSVATRALTVPVLPKHVWRDRIGATDGDERGSVAAVFETSNVPPVGSGPLSHGGSVPGERLTLERNDDHFLVRDDPPARYDRFGGGPPFERLVLDVVGAGRGAVERVASGQADGTFSSLPPETVPRIARAEGFRLYTDPTDAFYVVGYNARHDHLSNLRFRRVLGGLIDQAALVETVFDGYATPAASPLEGTGWLPERLRWDGEDPVTPFLGTNGELDVERVRDAFREVGYRYDGDALVTP